MTTQLKPGTLLDNGKYRILSLLGKGAFGDVYLARHIKLDGLRAIKIVRRDAPGVGSSVIEDYRRRFELENRLAEQVKRHANVIQVDDVIEDGEFLASVMEYAPGGNLADLLAREGPQPESRVRQIIADVARGLIALHEKWAIHRDVKPANILLAENGTAKIADFGLAQWGGLGESTGRSREASLAQVHPGTPNYMSPEHSKASTLTQTSDVYSLGCVAFELLTGQPWIFAAGQVDSVRELRPEVSQAFDAVIMRMLNDTPGLRKADRDDASKRFVSMGNVLAAIETLAPASTDIPRVGPAITPDPIVPLAVGGEQIPDVTSPREEAGPIAPPAPQTTANLEDVAAAAAEAEARAAADAAAQLQARAATERSRQEAEDRAAAEKPEAAADRRQREEVQRRRYALEGTQRASASKGLMAVALVFLAVLGLVGIARSFGVLGIAAAPPDDSATPDEAGGARSDDSGTSINAAGIPDIVWLNVPAGRFIMGSDTNFDEEKPRRTVTLPAYKISKYETTNAQFQAFVDAADGYSNEGWWNAPVKLAAREAQPGSPNWSEPDRPRDSVSWYDAVAYTRWLTARLRQAGELTAGDEVRLPTEEEWEKAARGTEGQTYPWGDVYREGYANIDERNSVVGSATNLARTASVGSYPSEASPYGALDMAGNVREWTLTEYENKRSNDLTNGRPRVVRGGSWDDDPDYARAYSRIQRVPGNRSYGFIGFRVVRAAPVR